MAHYEITKADLAKRQRLMTGAVAAPVILTLLPAILTILAVLIASTGPPVAAVMLFAGLVLTVIGFLAGATISALLLKRRSDWTAEMRERIAADGIHANEIDWFRKELKSSEKRALKAVEARDLLLGDAYRDGLASRLTATRIVRSSKRELLLAKRRQNSLKQLRSANAENFRNDIIQDIQKISSVADQAKAMLLESEARLQMIEAAAMRGGMMADSELALKKLAARSAELPLALESARLTDDIRKELEADPELGLDTPK